MPIPNDAVTVEATDPQLGTWLYEGEGGRAYADFRLFQHSEDLILRLPNDAITRGMGLVILPDPDAEPLHAETEAILVVDDVEEVRDFAAAALKMFGYTVLEAGSGAAALDMVETDGRPIHLALLDIMMPQMDGFELAKRLKGRRPGVKVLHMSGQTEGVTGPSGLAVSDGFIPKPFNGTSLTAKVREVLDGRPCS